MCEVRTPSDAAEAFALKLPTLIVGKGSNCLFDDAPFEGLVIVNKIDTCDIEGNHVNVGAGASFSLLGVQTARKGLSGLEFASGIPATVGGAIFMNAGANGQETASTLRSVTYMLPSGEICEWRREELTFGYRTSPFQRMAGCILSARFELTPKADARAAQLALVERRMQTQPLRDKSAGCIFRNPKPEMPAGKLIEECGLKGVAVGGAKVSEMHANFLINAGGARASDVRELIALVQERVMKSAGVHLEPEIRMLP